MTYRPTFKLFLADANAVVSHVTRLPGPWVGLGWMGVLLGLGLFGWFMWVIGFDLLVLGLMFFCLYSFYRFVFDVFFGF